MKVKKEWNILHYEMVFRRQQCFHNSLDAEESHADDGIKKLARMDEGTTIDF